MPQDLMDCPPADSWYRRCRPRLLVLLAAVVVAGSLASAPAAAGEHTIGLGVHFWQTVDDLQAGAGLEDDGVGFLASYQYKPWQRGLFKFEIDLEYFDDGYGGSSQSAYSPILLAVFGNRMYVAGGIGVTFSSGLANDPTDPFFAARFGYDLRVLPGLSIDLNLNYRTNAFDDLGAFDTDAITVGAIARLKL